jgi:hypothetical protein
MMPRRRRLGGSRLGREVDGKVMERDEVGGRKRVMGEEMH